MKIFNRWLFQTFLTVTLHSIFDNCIAQQSVANSERLSNFKIKDSTEKIFYDANASILNKRDSSLAKYFRIINYRNGKIFGAVTDFFISGNPYITGNYTDNYASKGYENGKFIYYYENSKIFQIRNYLNGLLEGLYSEFYPSGLIKTIVSFVKGTRYGCEYFWDENGKLTYSGFFDKGVLYHRTECDTSYIAQQKESITKVETLKTHILDETKAVIQAEENSTLDNVTRRGNNQCEKNNTGAYCFNNTTQNRLIVTLYIQSPNTGNYIQINRFDNVSFSWSSEAIIAPGICHCFQNVEATSVSYLIRNPTVSISYAQKGTIVIEKCQSKTFFIK